MIISKIARGILFLWGWNPIDKDLWKQITYFDRSIWVYSHTSYFDICIVMLYIIASDGKLSFVKTLVQPQAFENKFIGNILTKLGAIKSSKLEDRGRNSVATISEQLLTFEKFSFLISPKGTIKNKPWRTGYYHIAKRVGCPIEVVTLDYETQQIVCKGWIEPMNYTEEEVQDFLKSELSETVPLHPESEIFPVKSHSRLSRGVVSLKRYAIVLGAAMFYYLFV